MADLDLIVGTPHSTPNWDAVVTEPNLEKLNLIVDPPLVYTPPAGAARPRLAVDGSLTDVDVRYATLIFSNDETEKPFLFTTLGTTDWYMTGFGHEPINGAAPGVLAWVKKDSRTATGGTLVISAAPGNGNSYRVGATFRKVIT